MSAYLLAIFLRMRRMIFPDLVFGSPAKHPCLLKEVHPDCALFNGCLKVNWHNSFVHFPSSMHACSSWHCYSRETGA